MILGILSDTHGHRRRARRAVEILRRAGAAALVHCGDVGDADVLDELAGMPAWFVWGNCDDVTPERERYARALGLTPPRGVPLHVELEGRVVHVFHGHEPEFERYVAALSRADRAPLNPALEADYLLYGHTHQAADRRIGGVRAINPGALHRVERRTVAALDLRTDRLEWLEVPRIDD